MSVSACKIEHFLYSKTTHGTHCRNSPKTDSSDLFRVYLYHIDKKHSIVVRHAVSSTEDQYKFGDVIKTSRASRGTGD